MSTSTSRTHTPTPSQTPSQALGKLTSISTKTLSLLLERQRSSTFSVSSNASTASGTGNTLHLPQISSNLALLRQGILDMEARSNNGAGAGVGGGQGQAEAVKLLRKQYERMRGMVLADGGSIDVPSLDVPSPLSNSQSTSHLTASPSAHLTSPSNASLAPLVGTPPSRNSFNSDQDVGEAPFTPYTDDPEATRYRDPNNHNHDPEEGYRDPESMLQIQREMMDDQDTHLTHLSSSIARQHGLSLQINDELGTQRGLLEELDTELDRTESGLGRARRRLDRVSRGLKGNGSTVAIGVLILLLLILIIAFKT